MYNGAQIEYLDRQVRMSAKSSLAAHEAVANVRAAPLMSAGLALIAIVVGFLITWLTVAETAVIAVDWSQQINAGGAVLVVSAKEGGVDLGQCDGMNATSGVQGAGGIFSREQISLAQTSGGRVDVLIVSAGFPAATWANYTTESPASVIVPEELADVFGLSAGANLIYSGTGANLNGDWIISRIDAVPEGRNRLAGVNDAVMFISSTNGPLQSCYISADPDSFNAVRTATSGVFGTDYVITNFLEVSSTSRQPSELMTVRVGYWVAIGLGLFLTVLHLVVWFMRRGDFALYRTMKMSNSAIRTMLAVEVAVIAALPFATGALAGIIVQREAPRIALETGGLSYLSVIALLVLLPLVGSAILLRQSTIEAIKGQ